jgi:hypothetical protein
MKLFLGFCAALFLSACVEAAPGSRPPAMGFDNVSPVILDVMKIEVIDNYHPPLKDPNVEHTFPTTPAVAVRKLAERQLVAEGGHNILRVIIEDASVVREEILREKKFWEVFRREPSERLKAKVLLRFELVSERAPDIVVGRAEVLAKRHKDLLEGISLADRDRAYFRLTGDLMDDVSDGMKNIVRNTFGKKI